MKKIFANGFFFMALLLVVGLLQFAAADEAEIEARSRFVLDLMKPGIIDREHPKFKTYDILGITATNGCGSKAETDYMAKLLDLGEHLPNGVERPEMFSLPPLVRYLYQFENCLSEEQKVKIKQLLSRKQNLFDHGTLNHAILQSSSWYLLAQYFPGLRWHHSDGRQISSSQLILEHKDLLLKRFKKFSEAGHNEQLSPTYALVNFFPLLNLVDFAKDDDLRLAADREANRSLALLRAHSFNGVIVPPYTRRNFQQRAGPSPNQKLDPSITQHLLWFYYGAPKLGEYDFQSRREPVYVVMLALSKWRPNERFSIISRKYMDPYQISLVTPSFSYWDKPTVPEIIGKATIAEGFAIGAGNIIFDPAGYNEDTQQFSLLMRSGGINNQIECYHPYWRGNLDEDAWSRDRSSPFMQSWLDWKQGVLLFSIPDKDPWVFPENNRFFVLRKERASHLFQHLQCRIPSQFERIDLEGNWIFVKEGKSFSGFLAMGGQWDETNPEAAKKSNPELADFRIFKIKSPRGGVYFNAAEQLDDFGFEDFKRLSKKNAPHFRKKSVEARLLSEDGKNVKVKFRHENYLSTGRVASLPEVVVNEKIEPFIFNSKNYLPSINY